MTMFKKAERRQAKLKLALTGPSGAGKTYSALLLAKGFGKKIALIDTENQSASLYADTKGMPEFATLEISPPYTIDKYKKAIDAAIAEGFEVLVIDSISHAWAGEGGLLAKKEALDSRGGNSYTNWASITKEQEAFKSALLNADIHLICTMRSKQDYAIEANDKGRMTPKKIGLAPVQRDGMEYEFTAVLDIAMDHNAAASKDRTTLFDGKVFKITEATGKELMEWLNAGKALTKEAEAPKVQTTAAASTPAKETTQAASQLPPPEKPFKIDFGRYVGKHVHEINDAELGPYFHQLTGAIKKSGKPPEEKHKALIDALAAERERRAAAQQLSL